MRMDTMIGGGLMLTGVLVGYALCWVARTGFNMFHRVKSAPTQQPPTIKKGPVL